MVGLVRWWTFRRLVIAALTLSLIGSAAVGGATWWTSATAVGHVYSVDSVPKAPVAMVLGAKVYSDGRPSPFLEARLDIARELYESGRVKAILVSGDNGRNEYNEVDPMRDWLIDRGIPGDHVIGDYAGFDSYDSCVRAREVFGVDAMTVVTQSFHIDRAVTLCRQAGIDANGVGDDTMRRYPRPWKVGTVREYLANVKAGLDVLVGRDPVFLGPRETSVDEAVRPG